MQDRGNHSDEVFVLELRFLGFVGIKIERKNRGTEHKLVTLSSYRRRKKRRAKERRKKWKQSYHKRIPFFGTEGSRGQRQPGGGQRKQNIDGGGKRGKRQWAFGRLPTKGKMGGEQVDRRMRSCRRET